MSATRRRAKVKSSSTVSAKDQSSDNEPFIPHPSRQGFLNDRTDFALDPSLIFDQLPQPFRRINKVLELIFDDAWTLIEQREKHRVSEQSKFVSAQHTSSTVINTPFPVSLISSHTSGTLCFFNGVQNGQSYLACYDSQVDEIINQVVIDSVLKEMSVFKTEASLKNTIYFLSVIDQSGFWKMMAYKNHQYYHLFTQYETEDESKRPSCLMTRTGLNNEYVVVSWFGVNHDSWVEVYKLPKDQWKSEIATQEQATAANKNQTEESGAEVPSEGELAVARGTFSRPTLLFKAKAPRLSPGSNNCQQLMKNTENSMNIGQGTSNHFFIPQNVDTKTVLIRDLLFATKKIDGNDRPLAVPKTDPPPSMMPNLLFIPTGTPTGVSTLAVSWPTTNQLLIYKVVKPDSKGKEASDARPTAIWPFSSRITGLSYDSKHEQLAVALESGNVCIIERTNGVNNLPTVEHISSVTTLDVHALDSSEHPSHRTDQTKSNGFFVLSDDGRIYRVQFKPILRNEIADEQQNITACFPPEQSKDTSKITRMLFFSCQPSNLFVSVNELNRIYINDALKCIQLCEIILSESAKNENDSLQIAFVDDARSIIIGGVHITVEDFVTWNAHLWSMICLTRFWIKGAERYTILVSESGQQSDEQEKSPLRLYRVPLEHFPSLETYYPERKPPISDDVEPIVETKTSKAAAAQAKKAAPVVEVDKTAMFFDEKIKETFRQRQSDASERRERLRTRWNEIKLHFNPVYEQTT